jgi:anaerobic selenocysteine-containing dehydrogenase
MNELHQIPEKRGRIMSTMNRRTFMKTALITGSAITLRAQRPTSGLGIEMPAALAKAPVGDSKKWTTIISDVDAHSQCRMRVETHKDRVIAVTGNASDPESRGELTLRGRYMQKMLYAPDRLQYPMKRPTSPSKLRLKRPGRGE